MAKSKYNNTPTGGHASKKEHARAVTLRLLLRAGIISDLQEQVKYELLPAQYRTVNGRRTLIERKCEYIADFVYRDSDGNLVVEDAKGMRTEKYIIKRKLMLYIHDIIIKEV